MNKRIVLIIIIALMTLIGCSGSNEDTDGPKPVAQAMEMRL
jgi:hypothetical protein